MARNRLLGLPGCQGSSSSAGLNSVNEEEDLILNCDSVPLEFSDGVDYKFMLDDIRNFVAFRGVTGGQVTTEDLLSEFNGKLPVKGAAIFRALLKEICTFSRNVHGQGVWQLKIEFQ